YRGIRLAPGFEVDGEELPSNAPSPSPRLPMPPPSAPRRLRFSCRRARARRAHGVAGEVLVPVRPVVDPAGAFQLLPGLPGVGAGDGNGGTHAPPAQQAPLAADESVHRGLLDLGHDRAR